MSITVTIHENISDLNKRIKHDLQTIAMNCNKVSMRSFFLFKNEFEFTQSAKNVSSFYFNSGFAVGWANFLVYVLMRWEKEYMNQFEIINLFNNFCCCWISWALSLRTFCCFTYLALINSYENSRSTLWCCCHRNINWFNWIPNWLDQSLALRIWNQEIWTYQHRHRHQDAIEK